jgi:hypothetical protein
MSTLVNRFNPEKSDNDNTLFDNEGDVIMEDASYTNLIEQACNNCTQDDFTNSGNVENEESVENSDIEDDPEDESVDEDDTDEEEVETDQEPLNDIQEQNKDALNDNEAVYVVKLNGHTRCYTTTTEQVNTIIEYIISKLKYKLSVDGWKNVECVTKDDKILWKVLDSNRIVAQIIGNKPNLLMFYHNILAEIEVEIVKKYNINENFLNL